MMNKSARLTWMMIVGITLALCVRVSAQQLPPMKAVQPGETVKLSLKDASGKTWTILAPGKKAVVVAFWTPDSDETVRQVSKLAKRIGNRADVLVLAITRGRDKEERNRSEKTAKKEKWPFPVVYDPTLKTARDIFGVERVPAFFVVEGGSGKVISAETNRFDKKLRNFTVAQLADRLSAGKSIPLTEGIAIDWEEDAGMRPLVGKKAPAFSTRDSRGDIRALSGYAGKNLLLVFWRPGCPHCRRELPKLQNFYSADAKKLNAEILAVAGTSHEEDKAEGEAFVSDAGLRFPVAFDSKGTMNAAYSVNVVPTIYIINPKGIVVEVLSGEMKNPATILRSVLADKAFMSGNPVK